MIRISANWVAKRVNTVELTLVKDFTADAARIGSMAVVFSRQGHTGLDTAS